MGGRRSADQARARSDWAGFVAAMVFVDLVESYFLAGYEYFAPAALKAEDQGRLSKRFGH